MSKIDFNGRQRLQEGSGAPTGVDGYVDWFNQTFTFARASVGLDHKGRKIVELKPR